jgi:DNA polymerase-1
MQNIPTRTSIGKKIRKIFKAQEGYVFADADYSQIELRVLAHIAEEETMIADFLADRDIHKEAAARVFGIPLEEVTKTQRSQAKAVNFGIVYGISDFGLAEQLGIKRGLAKQYIEQYMLKYNKIKIFMDDTVKKAEENGFVETLYKRRRDVPEIKSSNYNIKQFGVRVAMNMPVQGTAADIIKLAMIKVYKELKQNKLQSKLILQVHDELLLEVKNSEVEQVKELLKRCMEDVAKLKVPIEAEVSIGENWDEAK